MIWPTTAISQKTLFVHTADQDLELFKFPDLRRISNSVVRNERFHTTPLALQSIPVPGVFVFWHC